MLEQPQRRNIRAAAANLAYCFAALYALAFCSHESANADEPVTPPISEKSKRPSPVTIEVGKIILEAEPIDPAPKKTEGEPSKPKETRLPDLPSEKKIVEAAKPAETKLPDVPDEKKPAPPTAPANDRKLPSPVQPEPLLPPTRTPSTVVPPVTDTPVQGPTTYTLLTESPYELVSPPMDPGRRWFARSELLLWWHKPQFAPALVTTDVPPGTGFLNSPTRTILYGNGPIGDPFRVGMRQTIGWWGDDMQSCGVEGRFFFLGRKNERFFANSAQFPVLVRPFFAPNIGIAGEAGQYVAYPPGFGLPAYTGSVTVDSSTSLWGAEFNIKELLCSGAGSQFGYRCDLFAGYRYLNLDESLSIRENVVVGVGNPVGFPVGTTALVRDDFSTVNEFHGAQVGTIIEARRGPFYLETRLALAMGVTVQHMNINGSQLVTQPGLPTQFFAGGLPALPGANIGKYVNTDFSVVPELHLHWGYQFLPRARMFFGYNFMFWSNVLRPGTEIDRVIDVSLVPNFAPPGAFPPVAPVRPRPQFNQQGYWAQGLDFGLEFRY